MEGRSVDQATPADVNKYLIQCHTAAGLHVQQIRGLSRWQVWDELRERQCLESLVAFLRPMASWTEEEEDKPEAQAERPVQTGARA